jgi:5-methylcytosine-specific restriction endonuclease McrA
MLSRKKGKDGLFITCRRCNFDEQTQEDKRKAADFEKGIRERLSKKIETNRQEAYAKYFPNRSKGINKKKRGKYRHQLTTSIKNIPQEQSDRENPRYAEWRIAILRRDQRTCALCGSKEWIQVHHIERWADNVKRRYDLKNGVSLCIPCHCKHHGPQNKQFPQNITDKLLDYISNLYERGKYEGMHEMC